MEQMILMLIDVLATADNQRVELLKEAVNDYRIKYPRSFAAMRRQPFAHGVLCAIENADTTEEPA